MKLSNIKIKYELPWHELISSVIVGFAVLMQPILRYMDTLISMTNLPIGIILFYTSHSQGGFDIFAPALASIPFSSRLIDEIKSKNIHFKLVRQSKRSYCAYHILSRIMFGGTAVSAPNVLLLIFCIIFGKPYLADDIPSGFDSLFQNTALEKYEFMLNGYMTAVIVIVLAFLFGSIWSMVSMLFGVLTLNKYAAVAFPMILYYAISLIFYGIGLIKYSPMSMMFPNAEGISSLSFVFVYQLIILLISVVLSYFLLYRRVKNA